MQTVEELLSEVHQALSRYSYYARCETISRGIHYGKFRLIINNDLFVQVNRNETASFTNFALISGTQRIFGRDEYQGNWHQHPASAPERHDHDLEGSRPVSLIEFLVGGQGGKAGAADFITKPWTNEQLVQAVSTALSLAATEHGQAGILTREELDGRWDFSNILGRDLRLLRLLEVAGRVSATDASVLRTGESGTGKERSRRGDLPQQPAVRRPLRQGQFGGDLVHALRERDVWACEGGLHRCAPGSPGAL